MASRPQGKRKVKLFYSYSHKDEDFREMLEKHLSKLRRQGIISDWHFRKISPGKEWDGEIKSQLNSSDIILLLVSPDFIRSTYCNDIEVKRAMKRHRNKEAVVIPVILRPVEWEKFPFGKLQALPEGAKAITEWRSRDEAFKNIAEGIRQVVNGFKLDQTKVLGQINRTEKKPKIIVVEDDKKWLEKIQNVLKAQKFEIEPHDHYSEELLSRLGINDYDLLITDISLNYSERSKEGTVLVRFTRVCNEDIPIIVITGYPYDDVLDVIDDLVKSRMDHFIVKSNWDPANFLKAVKDSLNKSKNRDSP